MSDQVPAVLKNEEPPIEAGEARELEDLPFHEARHRAEAARSLASLFSVTSLASNSVCPISAEPAQRENSGQRPGPSGRRI